MKKTTIALALFLTLGLIFTSCNESKKENSSEVEMEKSEMKQDEAKPEEHEHSADMAMDMYQCPMKCEGDKSYDKLGSCPKCKMDLKKVEK